MTRLVCRGDGKDKSSRAFDADERESVFEESDMARSHGIPRRLSAKLAAGPDDPGYDVTLLAGTHSPVNLERSRRSHNYNEERIESAFYNSISGTVLVEGRTRGCVKVSTES